MLEITLKGRSGRYTGSIVLISEKHFLTVAQVKLYYADTCYELCLEALVTIWTTRILSTPTFNDGGHGASTIPAPIRSSIIPGRDSACRLRTSTHEENKSSAYRTAFSYNTGNPLVGLVTLNNFTKNGGDETPEAKLWDNLRHVMTPLCCSCSTLLSDTSHSHRPNWQNNVGCLRRCPRPIRTRQSSSL